MTAKRTSFTLAFCLALFNLTACATPEHRDAFVLGAATEANIAAHAERSPDLPNNAAVNGESGSRAAEAVRRLRDAGPMKPSGTATTGG